ncbi:glyoxylase-like metal-dependent hydrolase (beta-lactamase superfamily II) [Kineococcus xinjiangensis]|uniref:Glyoxylase-like metal-dependent hydrolase (Beta-lactamase superfamily II) n=1 Tax=Kineococcus xinjiangensis TaxID=512762 RepID=A0A2S6IF47_9ACTN|nr:MBL fold metallo-hydrolase [Kineococcus xinjiangensis]PPK92844.1 glyoxylase-like metal-dependent hydrolase (beta-lactamase superfamily II) [Kineococcus xinjiangensis]
MGEDAGGAWAGGDATPRATCVLAPNPGAMTLEGTNTWVLSEPGSARAVVVDPGPDHPGHLERIRTALARRRTRLAAVLLTHSHLDHTEAAERVAAEAGVDVHAASTWTDGEELDVEGLHLVVLRTPGHTADSVCFALPADRALLTGDTVLGRGSTVLAEDGSLTDFLATLDRLSALAHPTPERPALDVLLPGHGPLVRDPAAVLEQYRAHREERLQQVRDALAAGAGSLADVVARVHPGLDPALQRAATWSVRAQLLHLGVELPAQHGC